ncbi:hypothetical protein [Haloferula sp. BvORR071]|uniref:hypothetical protein n=1 Tax=Haloferula sp. BvORR071 TaxID=1396141 RepID=UPI000559003B|nr:hypothetical protein [Haloferula sp. BvORR071]
MQRWIVVGALVLFLLGGGGLYAVWKIKQQHPDFSYIPLPFRAESTEEQRKASVEDMRAKLLTDEILTGVVRDCGIVTKWKLPSESAAVTELRKRVILKADSNRIENIDTEVMRVGFSGVVSEHDELQALSHRLMDDALRIISQSAPAPEPASSGTKF